MREHMNNLNEGEELGEAQEEAISVATEIFEDSWKQIKREIEGASKKEACKYSFILGFLDYMKLMDKKSEFIENEMKNMPKEEIEKLINGFKEHKKATDMGVRDLNTK